MSVPTVWLCALLAVALPFTAAVPAFGGPVGEATAGEASRTDIHPDRGANETYAYNGTYPQNWTFPVPPGGAMTTANYAEVMSLYNMYMLNRTTAAPSSSDSAGQSAWAVVTLLVAAATAAVVVL